MHHKTFSLCSFRKIAFSFSFSPALLFLETVSKWKFFPLHLDQLVSHEIEAGGKAFTGGKSPNGPIAASLHYEVTLLQLYSVALSAGKAHRDHKHHHVHKFDHNGEISTTTTPAPPPVMISHSPFATDFINSHSPSFSRQINR
jgi:hypothetical protein